MLEDYIQLNFPTNSSKKLNFYLEKQQNLIEIFEYLKKDNEFILKFMEQKGMTDDGPILLIHNKKQIHFDKLKNITVKPGDKLYFIPPILGG